VGDPIVLAHEAPFNLGPLRVTPSTLTLERAGERRTLEPKVMQVLVALARAGGEVVSRDDLVASCWDGRFIGEDAINRVVYHLRRQEEDFGAGAFRIETIRRVGFRLSVPPPADAGAPARVGRDGGPRTRRRMLVGGGIAVGAVTVGAVAVGSALVLRHRRELPPPAREAMGAGLDAFRQGTPDQVAQAIAFFRKATSLAPRFAEPWAQLALAYQYQSAYGAPNDVQPLAMRAREAAGRAMDIDPDNADAQAALAALHPFYRNWLDADAAAGAVLTRHPDNFSINRIAGQLANNVGRLELGRRRMAKALSLDAQWPKAVCAVVSTNWALGRLDEADRWMAQALAQWPRHYSVWFMRQRLLSYTGRPVDALAMIEDVANRPLGIPEWNFEQCRLEAQALKTRAAGDVATAARSYADVARRGFGLAMNAVQFLGEFGLVDDAFQLLDALYSDLAPQGGSRYSTEQGQFTSSSRRETWFLWLPMCARLRADGRMLPLLRDVGLVDYWRRTGSRPDVAVPGL
jgi:DNA-binding winged helix-turn-helix (wHTH) protein/tetratricopeptide (TPR) repeat protein